MPKFKQFFLALIASVGLFIVFGSSAYAATITVNSNSDTASDDGECTLREAIDAANDNTASGATGGECDAGSGNDTINFIISGTADFTNSGQDGYTIAPNSQLPDITQTVRITGYSQTGSQHNTAVAPDPFDGIMLIEIDGSSAGSGAEGLVVYADNVEIDHLVINNFGVDGVKIGADNISITGCYIGTDPAGTTAKGNEGIGVAQAVDDSDGLQFGGLNPEDRNIVSGNMGGGLSPNIDSDNWVIQGNYFGLDATGLAALPNSQPGGDGALSIDNSSGHIVGGSAAGAINVISGNNGAGIEPSEATNLTIQGNYIGTDYTGLAALPNGGGGISPSNSADMKIGGDTPGEGNVISGNTGTGIDVNSQNSITIQGNYIGVGSDGATAVGNTNMGVHITYEVYDALIGGSATTQANIIANNGDAGVGLAFDPATDSLASIIGNQIYSNDGRGIALTYGSDPLTNDALDSDTGPNDLLNYPQYTGDILMAK